MRIDTQAVVIGGGFSGSVTAAQLLRRAPHLGVALIDNGPVPARGLAYGTKYDCHLLNVPACDMSAFPEEPDHFLKWAQKNSDQPVQPRSFLPRPLYGRYLGSLFADSQARSANFTSIRDEAIFLTREANRYVVRTRHGSTVRAEAVVLALGNFPPASLRIPGLTDDAPRYRASAWATETLENLEPTDEILLIGSGLTAVDIAIALHSREFKGKIHLLSRHGLLPLSHRASARWPRFWNETSPRHTRDLMRLVRSHADAALLLGSDWRAVMDSLRPHIQKMWLSLSLAEQRRFLRHVRAYWDVHRHRIAPEIAQVFSGLLASAQAETHAGRLTSYAEQKDFAEVSYQSRKNGEMRKLRVTRVINCSGPEANCRRIKSPLLTSLFAQGFVRQDALSLGLDTDERGALINASGQTAHALFVIGPARKGNLWETTAVPELRVQAADVAQHLIRTTFQHGERALHEELVTR